MRFLRWFFPKKKKSTLRINYKSGLVEIMKCDSFKVTLSGDRITKVNYEGAVRPFPLHIGNGLDSIESIWELT